MENEIMRVAAAIVLTDDERAALSKWALGRSTETRLVLRAKIVLAAAGGAINKQIATDLETDTHTVGRNLLRRFLPKYVALKKS
jgi:FixJ family two-component response regulator